MLRRKNVNNDVSKDSPIHIHIISLFCRRYLSGSLTKKFGRWWRNLPTSVIFSFGKICVLVIVADPDLELRSGRGDGLFFWSCRLFSLLQLLFFSKIREEGISWAPPQDSPLVMIAIICQYRLFFQWLNENRTKKERQGDIVYGTRTAPKLTWRGCILYNS